MKPPSWYHWRSSKQLLPRWKLKSSASWCHILLLSVFIPVPAVGLSCLIYSCGYMTTISKYISKVCVCPTCFSQMHHCCLVFCLSIIPFICPSCSCADLRVIKVIFFRSTAVVQIFMKPCIWICIQIRAVHRLINALIFEPQHAKKCLLTCALNEKQISLHFSAVWSGSLLFICTHHVWTLGNIQTPGKSSSLFVDMFNYRFAWHCSVRPLACFEREKVPMHCRIAILVILMEKKLCVITEMLQYYKANCTYTSLTACKNIKIGSDCPEQQSDPCWNTFVLFV